MTIGASESGASASLSSVSGSSSTSISATVSSKRFSRLISAETSWAPAAAGLTFMPVIIEISSIVRTLVGSAIARITVPSSKKPTGTAW